jgi:hypothetical protein
MNFGRYAFFYQFTQDNLRTQYRSFLRYSGQYNLLFCTVGLIWYDHYLDKKIKREVVKLAHTTSTLEKIK